MNYLKKLCKEVILFKEKKPHVLCQFITHFHENGTKNTPLTGNSKPHPMNQYLKKKKFCIHKSVNKA